MYECRVTADKVYSAGICRSLESLRKLYRTLVRAGCSKHSNRSHGNSLVDYRDTVLLFYLLTHGNKPFSLSHDLFIDLVTSLVNICINTVKERNAHCRRSDVEAFVLNHSYSFKYIVYVKHL